MDELLEASMMSIDCEALAEEDREGEISDDERLVSTGRTDTVTAKYVPP